ncbi:MAG TPA: LUD domain-containing protein, partial [Desulfobaccales bacterium]|nr:LUD domain-containing protein [Desulfobaccales bacterium]
MDTHQITFREKLAEKLIKKLTKRRMEASYAPTTAQAREEVLAMIPAGATVSRCGSMSLVEMGLWKALAAKTGVEIIDPYRPGLPPE